MKTGRTQRSPYLGIVAVAVTATMSIETWARRRGYALEGNVPMFGLLLALPGLAVARAARGARRSPGGTGTKPRSWARWSVAAAAASIAAAAGTRTAAHIVAPPQLKGQPYHYRHFHYGFYGGERPTDVGATLLDAKVTRLDGSAVRLRDLIGERPLVIEFGSISCPIYTEKVDRTNAVADAYRTQADFAVLYTREAHPGANYDAIQSMEDKRGRAADLRSIVGEQRQVVLDDVDGAVHRHYGAFPNSLLVVGKDRVVTCWAEWTTADLMEREIRRVLDNGGNGAGLEQTMITYNFAKPGTIKGDVNAFLRPGVRALADFVLALPRMGFGRIAARMLPKSSTKFRIV
jgi:hypothetical protein